MVRNTCAFFLLLTVFLAPYKAEAVLQEKDTTSVSDQKEVIDIEELESPETKQINSEEQSETDISSDLVLFFGRFHPIFVHLPIGFLLFAFLLEFVSLFKRYEELKHAVPFALLMGILSGVAAGITGYLLSSGGGYSEDLLIVHQWLGISVMILSLVALIIRLAYYEHIVLKKVFRTLLIVMVVAVMVTGHFGGSLTHGSDYLFRYTPEPLRSWIDVELEEEEQIELIEDLDTAVAYDDVIAPIIRTRCQSCHNPDRREGELLLTSFEQVMEGGESGSVIVEHHAEESELYKRLLLPEKHENRMPPRGRRQLTHDQIRLIAWWIDNGLPTTQMISELEISEDISDVLHSLTVDGQSFFDSTQVSQANEQALEQAREGGFRIAPIAEDLNFLQVRVSKSRRNLSREDIALLLPVSEQITWLNLSRIMVADTALTQLSEFKNLTRLSLQHTAITDSTLSRVRTLEYLEYLNLYATEVSDEGVKHLENLKNLKELYLWQTNVSKEAVEDLRIKMAEAYIDNGYN